MTKDLEKGAPNFAVGQYPFTADRLYLQWKELNVSVQHGIANAAKPVISEDDLQRFLQKFTRSDSWEMLQRQFSEKNSDSPVFVTKKFPESATKKAPVLLPTILATLFKLRPHSGRSQSGSKDICIIRPPGSSLNSVAEFFLSPKTMEGVVIPIISDMQVEHCEALAADRKIKAGWVRLRGYWSLFKALGLYSIVKMFFEMWRKLSSG